MVELLDLALTGWGEAARSLELKPWLLYLPCKERVLHERLTLLPGAPPYLANWRPTDLPDLMRRLCGRHGIEFIDATGDLLRLTSTGVLSFNTIWDSHLNKQGSATVGHTLAAALSARAQ
jgi:hypothetical protein